MEGRNDYKYSYLMQTPEQVAADYPAPVGTPGKYFSYSNQMYATGIYAATRSKYKTGTLSEAYAQAMKDYVFVPLGMNSTYIGHQTDITSMDYAIPIEATPYGMKESPFATFLDSIEPAGDIYTNINDMMKYLLEQINNDDPEQLSRRAHIIINSESSEDDNPLWYGLGLMSTTQNYGKKVTQYTHDGGMTGGRSHMVYYPNEKIGVSILINDSLPSSSYGYMVIGYKVIIQALHTDKQYKSEYTLTDDMWRYITEVINLEEYYTKDDLILKPTQQQIDTLVGKYRCDELGEAEIKYENGHFIYTAADLLSAEIHYYINGKDFCFTDNHNTNMGMCAHIIQPDLAAPVTGFDFGTYYPKFKYAFTRVEDNP